MPGIGIGIGLDSLGGGGNIFPVLDVLYDETLISNTGALNNFTLVTRIRMDDVSSPIPPDFDITGIKLSIQGTIESVYVGVKAAVGNEYDAQSLSQVFFSGNPGVSAANTVITESDLLAFSWNKTDALIVSMYTGLVNAVGSRNLSATNYADLFFTPTGDQASTPAKTPGFNVLGNNLYYIPKITLFG